MHGMQNMECHADQGRVALQSPDSAGVAHFRIHVRGGGGEGHPQAMPCKAPPATPSSREASCRALLGHQTARHHSAKLGAHDS